MNPKARRLALVALSAPLIAGTIGCGGGKSYPDAKVDFDAQPDGSGGSTAKDAADAVTTPPTIGPGGKVLVKGSIDLIGSGPDTCTNQVPPSGDRWCGFARPSAILGANELWVINVTQSAPATPITCHAP